MDNQVKNVNEELNFEERIKENFDDVSTTATAAKTRLNEVNKKLPSWSLEPPMTFINK